jgi:hypothetical protein
MVQPENEPLMVNCTPVNALASTQLLKAMTAPRNCGVDVGAALTLM